MKIIDPETDMADLATWCSYHPKKAAAEIERLRSWMYEAINSLGDPQDACDHQDSEVAALRATIDEAIGKLRTGLADANEQSEPPLVHVGRDGQPHNGPRAACTICFMWDQIASNEQNGDGNG